MSDTDTLLDQIGEADAEKEVLINELIDSLSPTSYGGRRASACIGLTWGYYGGRWNGTVQPHGVFDLPASSTARIVAARTTGEIILDTPSDNLWADSVSYAHLYEITTGATTVADGAWEDRRTGNDGLYGGAGGSGAIGVDIQAWAAALDQLSALTPAEGAVIYYDGTAWAALAAGTAGYVLRTQGAGEPPVWARSGITAIQVACSDETTALTTGTAKATFRMPYAFTLTGTRASLTTAQGSGSLLTVDINEAGTTVLSTKITLDNGEKTSTTAATAAVISDTSIADDAEITIDIDQIGTSGAAGLKVTLLGYPT